MASTLSNGLVNNYSFSSNADDSVGSDDGVVDGATNSAGNGKIGNGYGFTTNDKITFPQHLPRPSGAVNIWLRPGFSTGDGNYYTVFADSDGSNQHRISLLKRGSDDMYQLDIHNDSGTNVASLSFADTDIPEDEWHMITCCWETNNVKLYLDKVLKAEDISAVMPTTDPTTYDMFIGKWATADIYYWDGAIDEFPIWNRVLTDGGIAVGETATGEIAELYNSGDGLQYPFTTVIENSAIMMGMNF